MRESNIVYQIGSVWVGRMPTQYTVYVDGVTAAMADNSYARTDDGLSIAIARAKYLAKRKGEK